MRLGQPLIVADAEALHVETVDAAVRHDARPVHYHREPFQFRGNRQPELLEMLSAVIITVQRIVTGLAGLKDQVHALGGLVKPAGKKSHQSSLLFHHRNTTILFESLPQLRALMSAAASWARMSAIAISIF